MKSAQEKEKPDGKSWLEEVAWDADGLAPVIAQDARTKRVLMVAWTDRAGLEETVATGVAVYWSRSRARRWKKGEESGFVQRVSDIRLDCDNDVLLFEVEQSGGIACHTGRESCFFHKLVDGRWEEVEPVLKDPAEIYGKAERC
jgi:phosphoribosyl-AMP cyclohydrolase